MTTTPPSDCMPTPPLCQEPAIIPRSDTLPRASASHGASASDPSGHALVILTLHAEYALAEKAFHDAKLSRHYRASTRESEFSQRRFAAKCLEDAKRAINAECARFGLDPIHAGV